MDAPGAGTRSADVLQHFRSARVKRGHAHSARDDEEQHGAVKAAEVTDKTKVIIYKMAETCKNVPKICSKPKNNLLSLQ